MRRASRTASTIGAALAAPIVALALATAGQAATPDDVNARPDLEPLVVAAVNDVRSERGLNELRVGSNLGEAAVAHSRDMVVQGYFSHDDRRGSFSARLDRFGVTGAVGENLGWVYASATPVQWLIRHWLASQTHRNVLLSPRFDRVGVGVVEGPFMGRPHALVVTLDLAG